MKKETILMMLKNLSKCRAFNSPEGLPLLPNSDYGKDCLNLTLTESYKKKPDWLKGFNTNQESGWSLLCASWAHGAEDPYFIFGDDIEYDGFDFVELPEYTDLKPANIEILFMAMIKDLHNEVITKFSKIFNIELVEIQGFKLPRYLFEEGLLIKFKYQGTLIKTGYKETWVSESLEENLIWTQYEAVKAYLSLNG